MRTNTHPLPWFSTQIYTKLVRVEYEPSQTRVEKIIEQARAAGYTLGTATTQVDIQGMHCASCVTAIEEALQRTPGVLTAYVNPATKQAHIQYMPGLIDREGLARAVENAGYQVRAESSTAETTLNRADRAGRVNIQP